MSARGGSVLTLMRVWFGAAHLLKRLVDGLVVSISKAVGDPVEQNRPRSLVRRRVERREGEGLTVVTAVVDRVVRVVIRLVRVRIVSGGGRRCLGKDNRSSSVHLGRAGWDSPRDKTEKGTEVSSDRVCGLVSFAGPR